MTGGIRVVLGKAGKHQFGALAPHILNKKGIAVDVLSDTQFSGLGADAHDVDRAVHKEKAGQMAHGAGGGSGEEFTLEFVVVQRFKRQLDELGQGHYGGWIAGDADDAHRDQVLPQQQVHPRRSHAGEILGQILGDVDADVVGDHAEGGSVEGAHTLFTARRNDDTVLIHDVDVVVGLGADASDKLLSKGLVDHGRHLPFCPLLYHSWAESTTDWVSGHVKRRLKGRLFT